MYSAYIVSNALFFIKVQNNTDETPCFLQSDRKQVLSSRIGGKVEVLQCIRISANKGLQHPFVV